MYTDIYFLLSDYRQNFLNTFLYSIMNSNLLIFIQIVATLTISHLDFRPVLLKYAVALAKVAKQA